MSENYYIGLDVHKETISIGWAEPSGEPQFYGTCASSSPNVERTLRRLAKTLGAEFSGLKVVYEAGPTGFVLARHLLGLGLEVTVVAPSLIPQKPGERVKTDKRDSLKLARLHRAGELKPIHVPDASDEAIRDVCRARTDAVDDLRRTKARLSAFLLRNGHNYPGKSKWTQAHLRYLRELKLATPAHKIVLEEYLQTVDAGEERIVRLERHMDDLLETWERKAEVAATMGLRGFQTCGAMIIASELGDLRRFEHPRSLMGFLGLVSGEDSSGPRRRQGAITKCGNSHARWILIEAAWTYRQAPKVSRYLTQRQEGLPREVKELSWRAQNRLSHKYRKLRARGVHENKVVVAVARELVAFLWELHARRGTGKLST
jgi:transposase